MHGADGGRGAAEAASAVLFGGDPAEADLAAFEMLAGELAVVDLDPDELAGGLAAEALARAQPAWPARAATPAGAWSAGEFRVNGRRLTGDDQVGPGRSGSTAGSCSCAGARSGYALARVGVAASGC